MMKHATMTTTALVSLFMAGCANSTFSGGGTKSVAPPDKKSAPSAPDAAGDAGHSAADKPADNAGAKDPTAPGPAASPADDAAGASGGAPSNPNDQAGASGKPMPAPTPAPPEGPGSDLTLSITDKDAKVDSFKVKNMVSGQWLPLTWTVGNQSVAKACSPKTKTTLQLTVHTTAKTNAPGALLTPGSCYAPLTQVSPTAVKVGVQPDCAAAKASFTLTCGGSQALQVVP